jgi:anti-sigma B factor antagonist
MTLRIEPREEGEIAVLKLIGHIVRGRETQTLEETLTQLVADGKTNIVMNLQEVTFIDSAGVGELVNGYTMAKKNSGSLKFASPSDRVRDVLKVARLLRVLDIHETDQEALASFEQST